MCKRQIKASHLYGTAYVEFHFETFCKKCRNQKIVTSNNLTISLSVLTQISSVLQCISASKRCSWRVDTDETDLLCLLVLSFPIYVASTPFVL